MRKLMVAAVFAIMAAGPALAQGAPPPEIEAGRDLWPSWRCLRRSDEFTEIDVMSGGWPGRRGHPVQVHAIRGQ